MDITPVNDTAKGPDSTFTGDVYITPIAPAKAAAYLTGGLVRFTPGARTFWHRHDRGQTLYVTEGVGLVASRGGAVTRIRPGDTVTIDAAEEA
jgi:quercetin dioxygenase-like cupin family protein